MILSPAVLFAFAEYIPLLFSIGGEVKKILDEATSNDDVVTKIRKIAPTAAPILEQIGGALFPKAKAALHLAAIATAAYDFDITKWIQGSANAILIPSPNLVVDGVYGPRTRIAVEALQVMFGITADGWAGQVTQGWIAKALAK